MTNKFKINFELLKNFNAGKLGIFGFAFFAPISIAISQVFIGITLLGWIFEMIKRRQILWQKTPLDFPILLFLLFQFIAVLNSYNIAAGFISWINTDWFILFFYAAVNLIERDEDYEILAKILLISGSVSAIYGIWQHFFGLDLIRGYELSPIGKFYRARGFFGTPLTYGGIQLTLFAILFPFYFIKKGNLNRNILLIGLLLIFASIIASYARSAWMGFGMLIFVSLFFMKRKYIYIVFGFIFISLLSVYIFHPDLLFNRGMFSMFDTSPTAPYNNLVRLKLWQSTINLIRENWVFGVGYSNFEQIFELYKIPFEYRGLKDPHNDILKVTALSGIFGGLTFIYMWISALWVKMRTIKFNLLEMNYFKAGILGGFFVVLSLLIAGITQEYYHDAENAQLWWFAAALGISGVIHSNKGDIK